MPGQKEGTGYEAAHQLVILHTFEHFVAADVNEGDHVSVTACGHEVGVVGAPRQIQVGARSGIFVALLPERVSHILYQRTLCSAFQPPLTFTSLNIHMFDSWANRAVAALL